MIKKTPILRLATARDCDVIRFIDKYDLETERQIIRGKLAIGLCNRGENMNHIFDLACWLGDWQLAGNADSEA